MAIKYALHFPTKTIRSNCYSQNIPYLPERYATTKNPFSKVLVNFVFEILQVYQVLCLKRLKEQSPNNDVFTEHYNQLQKDSTVTNQSKRSNYTTFMMSTITKSISAL